MKKRFTFLIAALMLLSFMTPSLAGWGQTSPYTYTFSSSQFTANDQTKKLGGVDWTLAGDGGYWGYNDTKGQQFGSGSKPYKSLSLTTTGISGNITSIVVNASTANDATATISCTVNGSALGTQAQSLTNSNAAYTFSGNASGTIVISMSQSTSKALYVKSLSVTYTTGPVTYTVTYDCNGGTSGCPTENPSGLSSGNHITLAAAPTKTHYTFEGWNDGTTTYAAGADYAVTSNVTMTAQWAINTHNITVQGNTHGTVTGFTNPVAYNTEVTLTYTHNDGEYYSATFSSTDVTITDGTFTMPDNDVSITVTETELPKYTVTFSDSGGTLTEAHYGAGVTLPTRTGDGTYSFAGWTTSNIAAETTTAPETILTGTYYPAGNITLYPVYTRSEGNGTVWQKITDLSTVDAGIYALITENGYAFTGTINGSGHGTTTTNYFDFDANNKAESAPDGTCELTLTAVKDANNEIIGYTMYNSTNKYLYASKAASGGLAWHNSESYYWYESTNWIYSYNYGTANSPVRAMLRGYKSSSPKTFRTYSSSTSNGEKLIFVKKVSNSTTYYISTLSSIAVPSFDPVGKNFSTESLTVTITVNEGCFIKYTTDGSDPETSEAATTTDSNSATVPVTVTTTIRALAYDGYNFSAEASQTYTRVYEVTLNSNGVATAPVEVVSGESTTLATPSNVPFGYSFRGWTATPATPSTFVDNTYTPNSNVTLYAVFGKNVYGDFEKVTMSQDDYSGYYLIVYNNTYALDSHYGNVNANTYGTYTDISEYYSLVNNTTHTIAYNETTAGLIIVAAKTTNGYSLYDTDGYLGDESSSTGTYLRWDSPFKAKQDEWTLGVNSIVNVKNTSNAIRWNNNSGSYRFAIYGTTGQQAIMLYKLKVNSLEGHYLQAYPSNTVATADITIAGTTIIESGAVLNMGTHNLINDNPANLIIEDGGQLILKNGNTVKATIKKSTAVSSASKTAANNLYAIASPVDGVEISSFAQGCAPSGAHNVYRYDGPTSVWQEYRNDDNKFNDLEIGRGYLYRSSVAGIDLAGEVTGGDASGEVSYSLSYNGSGAEKFRGLNLVGNPFTHNITWSNLDLTDVEEGGCYVLNEDPEDENHGKWQAVVSESVTVKPMQAFFVQATDESASITFKNTAGGGKGENYANDNIMFEVKNSMCSDEAYVLFKEGHGLNKIEHRNAEIPMLYVMDNGQNFAIADMSDDTRAINLGFEAKTIGQYTISLKAEGQYSHMSLYDKVTNTETDMLLEDSYTFVGTSNDRKDRFVLNLNYKAANIDTESDIFAYQSGSDIIIRGDGELHVFDVMGRLVLTQRVNGVETISMQSQGVYIFKLNGMTQKIVVR